MPDPAIRQRRVGNVVVLSIEHTLKGEGEASLKVLLDRLVLEGQLQIIVDLEKVPYIDSTELGRLIRCHISVRQAGGRVRLCNLSEKAMSVMRLTRLDSVLDIYPTEAQALAEIRSAGRPDGA